LNICQIEQYHTVTRHQASASSTITPYTTDLATQKTLSDEYNRSRVWSPQVAGRTDAGTSEGAAESDSGTRQGANKIGESRKTTHK